MLSNYLLHTPHMFHINFCDSKTCMYITSEIFFKRNNFVYKFIFGIKEIQSNGLIKDKSIQSAPNLGQVTSGTCQSGASLYIQGHTLQRFKVNVSLTWGTWSGFQGQPRSAKIVVMFLPPWANNHRVDILGSYGHVCYYNMLSMWSNIPQLNTELDCSLVISSKWLSLRSLYGFLFPSERKGWDPFGRLIQQQMTSLWEVCISAANDISLRSLHINSKWHLFGKFAYQQQMTSLGEVCISAYQSCFFLAKK